MRPVQGPSALASGLVMVVEEGAGSACDRCVWGHGGWYRERDHLDREVGGVFAANAERGSELRGAGPVGVWRMLVSGQAGKLRQHVPLGDSRCDEAPRGSLLTHEMLFFFFFSMLVVAHSPPYSSNGHPPARL